MPEQLADDRQAKAATGAEARVSVAKVVQTNTAYKQPDSKMLSELVQRLAKRLPPVLAKLDRNGKKALLQQINISHTLYAGWIYWFGREHLATEQLTFLETNKLCDRGLLQQRAIDIAKKKRLR
jgi:hypothetical protein